MDDMNLNLTDEEFIIWARKACANSIINTATGAYLDEALQRLDRANALIDDIKAQVSCGGVKHVGRIYSMIKEWQNEGVAVAEKSDDDRFVEHLGKAIKIVETWPEWKRLKQMLSAWDATRQEQLCWVLLNSVLNAIRREPK